MKDWMRKIKPGDALKPDPLWNESVATHAKKLKVPAIVLDTEGRKGCQSGLMLKVKTESGATTWLDAGWFLEPEQKRPLNQED